MSSYNCTPTFPPGTNADTHYRIKSATCSEPCECPVKERPPIRPKGRSYGAITMQDGVYEFKDEINNDPERRGLVRYSEQYVPEILPKVLNYSSEIKSFDINLFYRDYKYVYHNSFLPLATNLQVEYEKKITRISPSKNPVAELKKQVAQYSDCYEAHKLRKKIIALSKMRNTVSNEVFRFGIQDL